MTLEIIGAGYPRTGTSSLRAALERLGFAPCGHMETVFDDPMLATAWLSAWERTRRGEAVDWPDVIRDDRATVDAPACLFWRELTATYPEAKVILGVRDPERWYESVRETIWQSSQVGSTPEFLERIPPEMRAGISDVGRMIQIILWNGTFGGRFLDREYAFSVFEAHNAAVQAALPPERLLVWEAAQGWEPLCAFLGVPVPDEPSPRLNDRQAFLERFTNV